uniref:DUF1758 domain-containing protein n=1 Tax=Trichuris muris TaxID=70415 RepID=A0A5S6QLZ4_TRIMR
MLGKPAYIQKLPWEKPLRETELHHTLLHVQKNLKMVEVGLVKHRQKAFTVLQTAKARLHGSNGCTPIVTCLFGAGSQRSFIRKQLADDLGLQGVPERLHISTFGKRNDLYERARRVSFSLKTVQGNSSNAQWIEALCVRQICSPVEGKPSLSKNWKHLRGLQLADQFPRSVTDVDILIGLDHYYDFMRDEIRRGRRNQPIAVLTTLNWVLCGRVGHGKSSERARALFVSIEESVDSVLKKFWQLDAIGICGQAEMEEVHSVVMDKFKENITFDGEWYSVGLPWKSNEQLPNNLPYAMQRLEQTEKRLRKNHLSAPLYSNALGEYLTNGWAEVAHELQTVTGREWYLPHCAVIRNDKASTKWRIVFDGSTSYQGVTLNDMLEPGSALQKQLVGILIRFRRFRIGLQADIKKMFIQIGLHEHDRGVVRFLWRDLNSSVKPTVYRFKRVCFGLNCSPFLALGVVRYHAQMNSVQFGKGSEEILDNMSDLVTSCASEESAKEIQQDTTELMRKGGFKLARWASNSNVIKDAAQEGEITKVTGTVLCLIWNRQTDTLTVKLPVVNVSSADTKRRVLSRGLAHLR